MLVAQEDACPKTFPPEACLDSEVAGVTARPPPLPTCAPCWTTDDFQVIGDSCGGGPLLGSCGIGDPGELSSWILTCDSGGPVQLLVLSILNSPSAGDCSMDVSNPPPSDTSGTYTDTEADCNASIVYGMETLLGFTCS